MNHWIRAFALLIGLLSAVPAKASTFQSDIFYGRRIHLTLWNEIKHGDEERFKQEVLRQIRAGYLISTVDLYTNGGDVDAAIGIGEQIRLLRAATQAPFKRDDGTLQCATGEADRQTYKPGDDRCECASACFIIWVAGLPRYGNYVRIHHPYLDPDSFGKLDPETAEKIYEPIDKSVRSYFTKMGVADNVVDQMFGIISKRVVELTSAQIADLHKPIGWLDELVLDRCKEDVPPGHWYDTPERAKYFECSGQVFDAFYSKAAQRYLDLYGNPGETVPGSAVKAPPVVHVQPSNPAAPPIPVIVTPPPNPPVVIPPSASTRTVLRDGPNAYYTMAENRDLDGVDLKPFITKSNQTSCAQACNRNSICQGFSLDEWNQLCILKTNITQSRLEPRSISGMKTSVGPFPKLVKDAARIDVYPDRYFSGDGYATFSANSKDECTEICRPNFHCVVFTYFTNQHLCRIFNSSSQYFRGEAGSSYIGIKTQSP